MKNPMLSPTLRHHPETSDLEEHFTLHWNEPGVKSRRSASLSRDDLFSMVDHAALKPLLSSRLKRAKDSVAALKDAHDDSLRGLHEASKAAFNDLRASFNLTVGDLAEPSEGPLVFTPTPDATMDFDAAHVLSEEE